MIYRVSLDFIWLQGTPLEIVGQSLHTNHRAVSAGVNVGYHFIGDNIGDLIFPMPVPVRVDGEMLRVEFTGNTATLPEVRAADAQIDPLMQILRKLPIVPTCEERRQERTAMQRSQSS